MSAGSSDVEIQRVSSLCVMERIVVTTAAVEALQAHIQAIGVVLLC